jgi:hypothetical protein
MGVQDFFLRQVLKSKMKDVPEAYREQIMTMVSKNPELWKKIMEEVQRRTEKGGEKPSKAMKEVMQKYRDELAASLQN